MSIDEKDLLKVGAEAALKPFAALTERLFGGAVDEIGGMWQDRLRIRRQIRQLQLLEKLNAHINQVGFEPQAIPDKIWVPALQSALNENDESLQDMWSALLLNASRPDGDEVTSAFVEILRQLSPRDALFLFGIREHILQSSNQLRVGSRRDILLESSFGSPGFQAIWANAGLSISGAAELSTSQWRTELGERRHKDEQNIQLCMDNLLRLGLIERKIRLKIPTPTTHELDANQYAGVQIKYEELASYKLTELGFRFIEACSSPQA